jgi:guanylate kinase
VRKGGRGIIFVVSAPSGAGKTTLWKEVLSRVSGLSLSVSYTTRAPRPGEREGKDYFFISREGFLDMVREGKFIEWAEVYGDLYGTPMSNLEKLKTGEDLILEIDTQGAKTIKGELKQEGVLIFIIPPSNEVLRERLMARDGDSKEAIKARLQNAKKELDQATWYDYIVLNEEIEEAVKALISIIIAERCKRHRVLNVTGGEHG